MTINWKQNKQMNFTTKDYIEDLNFSYFETYSFQRKGDFDVYEKFFNRYVKDENSLTQEELVQLKKLRGLNLYKTDNNFIIKKNGQYGIRFHMAFPQYVHAMFIILVFSWYFF